MPIGKISNTQWRLLLILLCAVSCYCASFYFKLKYDMFPRLPVYIQAKIDSNYIRMFNVFGVAGARQFLSAIFLTPLFMIATACAVLINGKRYVDIFYRRFTVPQLYLSISFLLILILTYLFIYQVNGFFGLFFRGDDEFSLQIGFALYWILFAPILPLCASVLVLCLTVLYRNFIRGSM